MASVNWQKYHSTTETKAHFRHNEKEARAKTGKHSNPDIDRSLTQKNYSIENRSYDERCDMLDAALDDVQKHSKKALRKDAVCCIGLETATPENLPKGREKEWFTAYHKVLCNTFGAENIIDTDVHTDEIHEYYDRAKKAAVMSRQHAHTCIIPRTPDGRLCAKEIMTRENMIRLNNAVESMTQREFGVAYMTGKTPRKQTVEQLKTDSLDFIKRTHRRQKQREKELEQREKALAAKEEEFKQREQDLAEQEQEIVERGRLRDQLIQQTQKEKEAYEESKAKYEDLTANVQAYIDQESTRKYIENRQRTDRLDRSATLPGCSTQRQLSDLSLSK